jgi:hypothetical protein
MCEAQKRFVDERGCLQRAHAAFAPQVAGRKLLQLVIHERNDRVEGLVVALVNPLKEFGDLHGGRHLDVAFGRLQCLPRKKFGSTLIDLVS